MKIIVALLLSCIVSSAAVSPLKIPGQMLPKGSSGGGGGTLENGLISYWKFDESSGDAQDNEAAANHLVDFNTTTYTTGQLNNCADPDGTGSNEYLSVTNRTSLAIDAAGDWTISAWVYVDNINASWAPIIDFAADDGSVVMALWRPSSANFRAYWTDSVNSSTFATSGALSSATWYHVVFYHDADNGGSAATVGIIIDDGTPAENTSLTIDTASDASGQMWVGWDRGGYASKPDCRVDEMGLWNRLLTSGEITTLNNGGSPLPRSSF